MVEITEAEQGAEGAEPRNESLGAKVSRSQKKDFEMVCHVHGVTVSAMLHKRAVEDVLVEAETMKEYLRTVAA